MKYIDKNNEEYNIRSPRLSDYERVKEICEARFGEGYLPKTDFEKWVTDADFCKVAEYGDKIVGVVYLMPEKADKLASALKLEKDYVLSVSDGKNVIHSRCAALDEEYEHRGIMHVIHEEIYNNIKKQGYGAVFAPAWTYNGYTPMGKMLNKFGFEFIGEKENLWYGMDGYKCIVCNGPCMCRAAIFQKKF